jgi:hypothetical protein
MALNTFGGYGAGDPYAMMDPLFFDSACAQWLCAAADDDGVPADEVRRMSPAVAGMGGGLDPGLGVTSGSRRRATMPADVLETQVCPRRPSSASWLRCGLLARRLSAAGARDGAACVFSRLLAPSRALSR